jgi:hypothetical protein
MKILAFLLLTVGSFSSLAQSGRSCLKGEVLHGQTVCQPKNSGDGFYVGKCQSGKITGIVYMNIRPQGCIVQKFPLQ